ncbi:NupC/NupG family nucleoside CNT transporter [Shouchella lehensis]|uniref:Nucleoside transporter n=1 Tax=Shouchella lehensis G1 TaxID=1246626 RepID=A0A060LPA9_9BACI|nr:nucleoside transporter C-terminal domain-containing protein [Shouchella lehensis]AIC93141.1 nucleoside transporter [Shouchella lehensis G1]
MVEVLWGLAGCFTIIGILYLLSENKGKINFYTVGIGFALQILLGFAVLRWDFGREALLVLSDWIITVIGYGNEGLAFVFGPLAQGGEFAIFAVTVLGMIIFLTVLISLLYHIGVMQWVVRILGGGIAKLMRTSYTESVAAAANMFLGNTQTPLTIKPYLHTMTRSQVFSLMVGCLSSVSGAVMIGLSTMGIPLNYLLTAAVMSAPTGIMLAKLMVPETEVTQERFSDIAASVDERNKDTNLLDVIQESSREGLQYAINVGLMLIAFISLIALLNGFIGGLGGLVGLENITLEMMLGFVFAPIAFLIGIPWGEAVQAGNLIAQKLLVNEFVAFSSFYSSMDAFSPKSIAILTFALSGFANFGAAGSLIGMLSRMVPDRKKEFQGMFGKALFAATCANLLNGAVIMIIL